MTFLILSIIVLGVFEIISNTLHLSKRSKELIGLSAKRQHQELSSNLGYYHFYIKAIIMLVFGVLFTASGLLTFSTGKILSLAFVLTVFAIYGIAQALYYRHPLKVWMSLVVYVLPLIIMVVLTLNVNEAESDSIQKIPTSAGRFVFPLILRTEPLNRLLVASFNGDPEYEGIEPQMFDDSISGRGLRILLYRKDKKVDVYWQPGVHFDKETFKVGGGTGNTSETPMSPSRFEITGKGVDIDIAFKDNSGRRIEITIKENSCNINPFPFLAPVGKNVENPDKLFAVYMRKFDFVRREGTIVRVKVGDRLLTPATFPITRDKQKVYFIRYASKLVVGEINPPVTEPVVILNVSPGIRKTGKMNLMFDANSRLKSCWVEQDSDRIELKFSSGFPNLLALPKDKIIKGDWQYSVSDEILFGGTYSLTRTDNNVNIVFDVTRKWKPGNIPFSFKVFTYVMRSFRSWPTTYKWTATVDLDKMSMESKWHRK